MMDSWKQPSPGVPSNYQTLLLVTALPNIFYTHVGQTYLGEQKKERLNKIAAYVCYIFNYTASSLSVCLYNERVVSTHI